MYQALYRKYRPKVFDDVLGQNHITETLKNQLASGRTSHAYLFTGTRGTGKTTCAKILARAVNCENPVDGNPCNCCPSCIGIESGSIPDVLEIDAASNNGVDNIRSLRDDSIYSPATVKKRVYIIDEVHMLSTSAFNALLKIMEEPPEHLMFILATTELNKVPATILSRCQRFSFKRIQLEDIRQRLMYVADAEHIALDSDAASLLARLSDGALRDALSLMDQCTVPGGSLTTEDIYQTLGLAGNIKTAAMMQHIAKGQTSDALELFASLYSSGKDVTALFSELCSLGRDLLMLKISGSKAMLTGGYDDETLTKLSKTFTFEALMNCVNSFQEAMAAFSKSANCRTDAELCIMKVCDPTASGDTLAIAARLSKLEKQLENISKNGVVAATPAPAEEFVPYFEPEVKAATQPVKEPEPVKEDAPPWDDAPPWSDDDAPPPFDDNDAPPEEFAPPVQEAPKPAAPKPEQPKPVSSDGPKSPMHASDIWPDIVSELSGKVDMLVNIYLNNSETTSGVLNGDTLTVIAASPFVLSTISKDEVGALIAEIAANHTGFTPTVKFVLEGQQEQLGDKLDSLIQKAKTMENIKII
ncbi:MAG: DNA polymerase III subunit gamma/tau [Ruminococcaceae bacterium]|nr:DNA polymerase III subunit gamma/tau [Oscillospiraceae bacterium]